MVTVLLEPPVDEELELLELEDELTLLELEEEFAVPA
jgi:hypothetical protein